MLKDLGNFMVRDILNPCDQEVRSLPDGTGNRPGFIFKGYQWYHCSEWGGSCPEEYSQVLKQLPPLLGTAELSGSWHVNLNDVPVAGREAKGPLWPQGNFRGSTALSVPSLSPESLIRLLLPWLRHRIALGSHSTWLGDSQLGT